MHFKQRFNFVAFGDIDVIKHWTNACDGFDLIQDIQFTVVQVIRDDHIITRFQQDNDGVRTNITYSSGD